MMVRQTMIALMIAAAVFAAPAWAAGGNADLSSAQGAPEAGSRSKAWNITIKMTANPGHTPGPCTDGMSGFANVCPIGPCACYTFSGTADGATGKGNVTFYETFDRHSGYNFRGYGCRSAYGEIDIFGKKDTEAIAFLGSDCQGLAPKFLAGGCALGASNVYIGGQGQCSGPYSETAAKTFKIKGDSVK